jgi:hypothetical protein
MMGPGIYLSEAGLTLVVVSIDGVVGIAGVLEVVADHLVGLLRRLAVTAVIPGKKNSDLSMKVSV